MNDIRAGATGSAAVTTAGGDVQVRIDDGIGTVEFAHPKGNSLPSDLLRRLASDIASLGTNDEARVIVVRSRGEGPFCAGASFDELEAIRDAATGTEFFMGFAHLILAMKRCPKLILARVHGKAVGGGVGVIAASDYALATEGASIRLSELAVGIGPFVVGPAIERRAGTGAFAALAIDADWRDAHWGAQHGLYARLYGTVEELDRALMTFAKRLAASSPQAMATLKGVLWRDTDDWERLLEERARLSGALVLSDITRNAIATFKATRPAP